MHFFINTWIFGYVVSHGRLRSWCIRSSAMAFRGEINIGVLGRKLLLIHYSRYLISFLYIQESENECRSLCFVVETAWWGKAGAFLSLSLLISWAYFKDMMKIIHYCLQQDWNLAACLVLDYSSCRWNRCRSTLQPICYLEWQGIDFSTTLVQLFKQMPLNTYAYTCTWMTSVQLIF